MVSNPESSPPVLPDLETVSPQRDGHVVLSGLNRPHKRNAFDRAMLADLSRAYGLLESDPSVRAGVPFAHATTSPPVWTSSTWAPASPAGPLRRALAHRA